MAPMKDRKALICSFCGKEANNYLHLISGQDGSSICTECVALCVEIHHHEDWPIEGAPTTTTRGDPQPAPALGRIDASWRGEYIERASQEEREQDASGLGTGRGDCVFCTAFASSDDDDGLIVHRGTWANVVLNKYPYSSGHLLVLPTRHVASLSALNTDERTELWTLVTSFSEVTQRAYHPDGLNIGANLGRAAGAGLPAHLHVHVLPRWSSDTNFMTTIGDVRIIPESLGVSLFKVREAWATM